MDSKTTEFTVRTKWSIGQRTPLWDALWHRILAGIGPEGRTDHPWWAESPEQRDPS